MLFSHSKKIILGLLLVPNYSSSSESTQRLTAIATDINRLINKANKDETSHATSNLMPAVEKINSFLHDVESCQLGQDIKQQQYLLLDEIILRSGFLARCNHAGMLTDLGHLLLSVIHKKKELKLASQEMNDLALRTSQNPAVIVTAYNSGQCSFPCNEAALLVQEIDRALDSAHNNRVSWLLEKACTPTNSSILEVLCRKCVDSRWKPVASWLGTHRLEALLKTGKPELIACPFIYSGLRIETQEQSKALLPSIPDCGHKNRTAILHILMNYGARNIDRCRTSHAHKSALECADHPGQVMFFVQFDDQIQNSSCSELIVNWALKDTAIASTLLDKIRKPIINVNTILEGLLKLAVDDREICYPHQQQTLIASVRMLKQRGAKLNPLFIYHLIDCIEEAKITDLLCAHVDGALLKSALLEEVLKIIDQPAE